MSVGAGLILCFKVFQDGNSIRIKKNKDQDCYNDVHRIVFIIWDDIMGDRCRLSAATEESTACTNSHAIKEPTYTQMYKHRHIANVLFFSFSSTWSQSCIIWFFILAQQFCFFFGLVTILFKGIKRWDWKYTWCSRHRVTDQIGQHWRTEHVFYAAHRLKMVSYVDLTERLCKHTWLLW